MAHELEQREGLYSFISNNQPAWHGLGTIVDHAMNAEEVLKGARLDYIVNKSHAKFIPEGVNKLHTFEQRFITYREDTLKPLGIVGKDYYITQNHQLFDFFDEIIDRKEGIYETAGVLYDGQVVFLSAKLPDYFSFKGNNMTDLYIVLTTSHDGSLSTTIMITPIRVVCNNTLNMAFGSYKNKMSIKHTKNAEERIRTAHKALGIIDNYTDAYSELVEELNREQITDKQTEELIAKLFTSESKNQKRIENIRDDVFQAIATGPGQEDIIGTKWGVLSGLSYYFGTKETKSEERRFQNILGGPWERTLNQATKLLIEA